MDKTIGFMDIETKHQVFQTESKVNIILYMVSKIPLLELEIELGLDLTFEISQLVQSISQISILNLELHATSIANIDLFISTYLNYFSILFFSSRIEPSLNT
jgi:hypothetical protein